MDIVYLILFILVANIFAIYLIYQEIEEIRYGSIFFVSVIAGSVLYKGSIDIHTYVTAFVFVLLVVLSIIDIKYKEVPDNINLLALTVAIFSRDFLSGIYDMVVLVGAITLFRYYVSFIIKKEALGEADIILVGTMGAMLGIEFALLSIFLSAIIALPVSMYARTKGNKEIAYIPFLAIATYLVYMFDWVARDFLVLVYS